MTSRPRISAFLAWLLAIAIIIAAVLGPLILGRIRFRMTELLENQYVGGEIATVFIVSPILIVSGVLALRRDRLASALAFGPAAYAMYTFLTAILGQDYLGTSGNVEKAFPLYVLIIAASFLLMLLSGWELASGVAPMPSAPLRRSVAALFLTIVLVFGLAWSRQIFLVYQGEGPTEYADGPTLFWLIRTMDFGVLLPSFAVTGIGLLRQNPVAVKMSYGLIIFGTCMGAAVLGMSVAMHMRNDPAANVAMTVILAPITIGLAILSACMMVSYRKDSSCPSGDRKVVA